MWSWLQSAVSASNTESENSVENKPDYSDCLPDTGELLDSAAIGCATGALTGAVGGAVGAAAGCVGGAAIGAAGKMVSDARNAEQCMKEKEPEPEPEPEPENNNGMPPGFVYSNHDGMWVGPQGVMCPAFDSGMGRSDYASNHDNNDICIGNGFGGAACIDSGGNVSHCSDYDSSTGSCRR